MKRVYLETTIVSYLTARSSRNLLVAAWQEITKEWWDRRRSQFELFTSTLVLDEARQGDPNAAKLRLDQLENIPSLSITDSAIEFAKTLINEGAIPQQAPDDALHISLSAVHHIDYLLTWNFKHIDNAETKPFIRALCLKHGLPYPEICTPQELMGDDIDER
ncbi:MAG: DNA-binding protein [Candidatus Latescibacteria bacterium]|nr:DNA-binding protein [Candidatus Latescibacterota bacterium]